MFSLFNINLRYDFVPYLYCIPFVFTFSYFIIRKISLHFCFAHFMFLFLTFCDLCQFLFFVFGFRFFFFFSLFIFVVFMHVIVTFHFMNSNYHDDTTLTLGSQPKLKPKDESEPKKCLTPQTYFHKCEKVNPNTSKWLSQIGNWNAMKS
jgi:hypothetical protein